jgi:DNA-directed RNA polymerase subunit RPC12/RpoP
MSKINNSDVDVINKFLIDDFKVEEKSLACAECGKEATSIEQKQLILKKILCIECRNKKLVLINVEEQFRSIRKIISKEDRKRFSDGIIERIRRRREDLVDPIIEYIDQEYYSGGAEIELKMDKMIYLVQIIHFEYNHDSLEERHEFYLSLDPYIYGLTLESLLEILSKHKIVPVDSQKKYELIEKGNIGRVLVKYK